jgi:hypothetical protein
MEAEGWGSATGFAGPLQAPGLRRVTRLMRITGYSDDLDCRAGIPTGALRRYGPASRQAAPIRRAAPLRELKENYII